MSNKVIDYKIILKRDGQTQQQRMPRLLDPSLVPIDARTKENFFNYLKAIAKEINFYDVDEINSSLSPNGTWEDFFNPGADELADLASKASLPPHIALWDTFIELYEKPKELMNMLTKRHLDFYYGDVLRLQKNKPLSDKAHVLFELKKNTTNTLLAKGTALLAGKDKTKKDLVYELTHDIVVNTSKITGLKSLFVSPVNKNFIRFAPIANSADGLGAAPDATNHKWSAFGNEKLPLAHIGFCLASDVLRMKEGTRTVNVTLTLNGLPATAKDVSYTTNLFKVSITGEKGWIGPRNVTPAITSADNKTFTVTFSFIINKEDPAVVNYNSAIHGLDFTTSHPLLQILINNEKADFGYKDLVNSELADATIEVQVTGMKDLQLENDLGTINSKKPFFPFGPTPDLNANFTIGCEEAFSKRLKDFSVKVSWKNIPQGDLRSYFSAYEGYNANDAFTASAAFQDAFNWNGFQSTKLFNTNNATADVEWSYNNPNFHPKIILYSLPLVAATYKSPGQPVASKISSNISYLSPAFTAMRFQTIKTISIYPIILSLLTVYKNNRKGILNLRLNHGFGFKEYGDLYANAVLQRVKSQSDSPALPAKPFAPEIQTLEFNYTATTAKTSFNGLTLNDYADEEVEFFHYGAFGQMREHAYNRSQHPFLTNNIVKLLPQHNYEGEFFIGLSGLHAEDSACILFQAAEGSANPDTQKANVKWSVLCDNYWKELTNTDFIFDTTNELLASGVIKFVIPPEATTENTIMPDKLLWLKAAINKDSDSVCNLTDVQSNAAIVAFKDNGNDPAHLAAPLAANTINKLGVQVGAIKSIKQPYASFGGQMQENSEAYYIRISERLRHKERTIALWDYERLILQHFPKVHKVKCINHASDKSFYAPGHVLVIVVPDLTNQNAVDPFQPRADKNTLDEVHTFLQAHSSGWAEQHVRNPFYEPVKVSVKVKLKTGFEFNYYEKIIDQKLQEFLSPWIKNTSSDVHFGGKVTKSMIVKFLEDLEFVDFLTDLSLFHSVNGAGFGSNLEVAEASNPAAILVSYNHHEIFNH